jgi:hypothetical protein
MEIFDVSNVINIIKTNHLNMVNRDINVIIDGVEILKYKVYVCNILYKNKKKRQFINLNIYK